MGDKGEGGVKNLKNWMTSFIDGSLHFIAWHMSNDNLLPYIFENDFLQVLDPVAKNNWYCWKKNLKSSMNTFKNGQQGNNDVSVYYYLTKYNSR